jgi:hypothetical protein
MALLKLSTTIFFLVPSLSAQLSNFNQTTNETLASFLVDNTLDSTFINAFADTPTNTTRRTPYTPRCNGATLNMGDIGYCRDYLNDLAKLDGPDQTAPGLIGCGASPSKGQHLCEHGGVKVTLRTWETEKKIMIDCSYVRDAVEAL